MEYLHNITKILTAIDTDSNALLNISRGRYCLVGKEGGRGRTGENRDEFDVVDRQSDGI